MIKIMICAALAFIIGCGANKDLPSIDSQRWKEDVKGCDGERMQMFDEIDSLKKEFIGLSQKQVIKVLGPPEQEELYRRSQKFFIYFIEPAASCVNTDYDEPKKLVIRLNALDRVSEVLYENY